MERIAEVNSKNELEGKTIESVKFEAGTIKVGWKMGKRAELIK
jgi:hypothetical protein